MVTLKDLALEVNRSVTTVSRALAGFSDVSPETITLVRETAARLGYVPNIQARRLQKQSSETIGVVAPVYSRGYAEPFFSQFLSGIGEAASIEGYDLLVTYSQKEDNEADVYRKLVTERKVDGFVLYRTLIDDPRVNYLKSINFPFAIFGQAGSADEYDYIDEDGAYAMMLVAEHLMQKGHVKVACLCPSLLLMAASTRIASLSTEIERRGMILDKIVEGCFDQKDGYNETMKVLSSQNAPTAIVCFNDTIAFGAINAIKDKGLRVGTDIAVTGFDDIPMAKYYRPPLTTIRQPIQAIGKKVTELLFVHLKDLKEGKEHSPRQILLKPELIERSSTER